jgi:hypothetical protein
MIDRRFSWILRVLNANRAQFETVFPPSWRMEGMLLKSLLASTFAHFKDHLDHMDIKDMVSTLKKTLKFEHELR